MQKHHSPRADEQGFALYMAIGFIVLISVLAGSVGNRLNSAIVSELRKGNSQILVNEAEMALSAGWDYVYTQDTLDPTWLATAIGETSAAAQADRTTCLNNRTDNLSSYYIASQVTTSERRRRYFIRKSGDDYLIFGCGLSDEGTRAAMIEIDATGGSYSRTRQRRY